MDINIKNEAKWEDARPKIQEVSVSQGLPKVLFYWQAASRWALILFAALAPVFFLPFTNFPVAAHKEILVFFLILAAFFALLGRILLEGRVRYPGHWLAAALLILVLVWGASSFFSTNQIGSLVGGFAAPDSFLSVFLFALLTFAIVMTFDRRDIVLSLLVFLASLALLGLFEVFQLLKVFVLPFAFAKNAVFNPVGSINDLGVLLAFGLVLASGLMSSTEISKLLKRLLGAAVAVFVFNLAVIDFWAIWAGLALAMIFMISFLSIGIRNKELGISSDNSEYHGLQLAYFQKAWLPSVILLLSALFWFIPSPLGRFIQTPLEVSPSFNATLNIAMDSARNGSFVRTMLGSGPNTFSHIFNLYKPAGINQTIFWSTSFNSGTSAMATWTGVVGIAGILALLFLMAAFVWTGIKGTAIRNASRGAMNVASQAVFVGVCYLFIMLFLYVANFTVLAFTFWGMGLFLAASLFFIMEQPGQTKSVFKEYRIFTSPPKTFLFSLLIVGLMVAAAAGIYFEINRYVAETYFSKSNFSRAIEFWPYEERYFQGLSQATFFQLSDLLARTDLPQETMRAQFQGITTNAIAAARQAETLNPKNPFNAVLLGSIYENLIPFISDSASFALSSYGAAVALDPKNPSHHLALARVFIALKDLDKAATHLEEAVSLKNDYAPARFLLVQVFDGQGKLSDAIRRAEELVSLNINDVGALFQLGFLYYKNSEFDKSRQVFERTVSLSENYSNARYFLGLIYDRAGEREKAAEQFKKIAELNPDNGEVKQILANLASKKPALAGIAPPAPAPQSRNEAPVQEGAKAPLKPLKQN